MSSTANPIMTTADCPQPCEPDLQLLDIPAALLTMILQHVPLQQRLGVCTHVCRAFYTAAVAATNSISITRMSSQEQCDHLLEWLQLHGGAVTCLDIQDGDQPSLASLPCPSLRDLSLQGLFLQPGLFSACTSLTRLLLASWYLISSPHATSGAADSNPLTQLSVLRSLRHLDLDFSAVCPIAFLQMSRFMKGPVSYKFPGMLLSQLVQLTCLQLGHNQVQSDAALQHLSALSDLQHLELDLQGWSQEKPTAAALTGLQQLPQLTALKLLSVPWAIDLHSMPAFTMLTALRVLRLQGSTSVDPAVLAAISGLQQLDLACTAPWDAEDSAAVLAAVGQQQGLVRLEVQHPWCCSTLCAAACAVLTASSHLQHLVLLKCELPEGFWQQMFPPTRCLPELSCLCVWAQGGPTQPLSHADTQAMVSCCPGLVCLALGPKLLVSSATSLLQVTGLTSLELCVPFEDSVQSLAQMTGLQRLGVESNGEADRVTASGLLQLTVPQQLHFLRISGAAYDSGLAPGLLYPSSTRPYLFVQNKAPEGAAPDLWLQLKGCCEAAEVAD